MDALLELQSCAHRLARAYYLRGYCAVAARINNKLGVDFMNPHRLQPLRHDRFPLAGFKQHRCYINDGPVKPNITMPSVQSESDVLAAVRNEFGIDHYNPRHVPVVQRVVEYDPDGMYLLVNGPADEFGLGREYERVWWHD